MTSKERTAPGIMLRAAYDDHAPFLGAKSPKTLDTPTQAKATLHPVAHMFPGIAPKAYDLLAQSLHEHGLRHPIVTSKSGHVVDGRHRLMVYERQGISLAALKGMKTASGGPAVVALDTDDPGQLLAYALDANLHRRHLADVDKRDLHAKIRDAFGYRPRGRETTAGGANVTKVTFAPTAAAVAKAVGVTRKTVGEWDAAKRTADKAVGGKTKTTTTRPVEMPVVAEVPVVAETSAEVMTKRDVLRAAVMDCRTPEEITMAQEEYKAWWRAVNPRPAGGGKTALIKNHPNGSTSFVGHGGKVNK